MKVKNKYERIRVRFGEANRKSKPIRRKSALFMYAYFFQNFHHAFLLISSGVGISCLCVCRCKLCSWCKSFVRSTFWLLKCSMSPFIASIKSVFSLCSVVFSLCSALCSNAIAKRTRMYSLRVTSPR